jgi:hypothetical protein
MMKIFWSIKGELMGQQNAKTNHRARRKTQQIKIKSSISFWERKTNYA